jgi:hypothetical protein
LVEIFSRGMFRDGKRNAPSACRTQPAQLKDSIRLSLLNPQIGLDLTHGYPGRSVRDLPCPGRQAALLRVGVFADPTAEGLSEENRHLRCYLIKTDDTDVIASPLPIREYLASAGYQYAAVAVDTPGEIRVQQIVCHGAQYKQLGTVLGGKAHHDIGTFPAGLRVREYPQAVTA